MIRCLVLALLGGCYVQGGLGAARGAATFHGSAGLILHLGQAGSVRAGAGGALGPFRPATGERGSLSTGPVTLGGEARILGTRFDSLVASFGFDVPVRGQLHVPDLESSEHATTFRVFTGVGYHHDWWQVPRGDGPSRESRIAAAITTALGAELWYGASKSALRESSTELGGSFSVTLELRGWLLGEFFDCVGNKSGCD